MNDIEIDLDQTDEQTLTYQVSDEALENAANTRNAKAGTLTLGCTGPLHTFCYTDSG